MKKKIHLWMPEIFAFKGGIQTYSAFLLTAIQTLYPQAKYDVFLKHDRSFPLDHPYLPQTQFHPSGNIPLKLRTVAFASQLIIQGLFQKPDLIITTHANFSPASYRLKQLTGIPYWVIAHGVEVWNLKNASVKKACSNAAKILAVSNYTRDRLLLEQNLSYEQIVVLPNTFDEKRFKINNKPKHLLEKYSLKPEQPIILIVSRLSADDGYKGYDKILEALPQIKTQIPNIHYIIVGKGDDRPRIEQLITQLGLQNNVTLSGFVPEEEICDYYNLCDVFAMPSKGEGFGIVYLEALACGKPCLGGNKDGAIDALCNGELGALVAPDNVEEIAQTLIEILQGTYPNSLMYQPEKLREKVIEKFGFERFKQTLNIYLQKQL
ncbi:MAG: glycosyltransferase family 4 protein [Gomphosphaeria aponina SAG 52.96 = DSM 107014]|uniref:Glycosyltransferase family 4 protein n=1 Tax=Gomphosphaeria aponina SAG 52.96 = DSM 107014 TaxID=1521640 RepID=A0A941GTL4_9CHRO|nr:glycosyltransferase family 4 protein [Gomphosphaeria aponina SAG 52.96 = DSM 107014]